MRADRATSRRNHLAGARHTLQIGAIFKLGPRGAQPASEYSRPSNDGLLAPAARGADAVLRRQAVSHRQRRGGASAPGDRVGATQLSVLRERAGSAVGVRVLYFGGELPVTRSRSVQLPARRLEATAGHERRASRSGAGGRLSSAPSGPVAARIRLMEPAYFALRAAVDQTRLHIQPGAGRSRLASAPQGGNPPHGASPAAEILRRDPTDAYGVLA